MRFRRLMVLAFGSIVFVGGCSNDDAGPGVQAGGGGTGGPSDTFATLVAQVAATAPEDTEPANFDGVTPTRPENTEPAGL